MSDKFTLNVHQVAELSHAFERCGWTNADIKKMSSGDLLARLLPVVRGYAEVTMIVKHIIDLDANPYVPEGWTVEEHRKGGQFEWDSAKITLFLSEVQTIGGEIKGKKLRTQLAGKDAFNANLLDYLLAHPYLIPEEWRGKAVFFWATVYRGSSGYLFVRYLYWDGGQWHWSYRWLGGDFSSGDPAAVRLAS